MYLDPSACFIIIYYIILIHIILFFPYGIVDYKKKREREEGREGGFNLREWRKRGKDKMEEE